ncbi:MAG: class I SAM-dependent methyltransferase [Chitinispirillaceae bacterium]|nr:class I SAM-dependent methyltransferase [Chitinispirillaceae bacterium]
MNMDHIRDHFESEAKEFDDTIIKLIPYYGQMVDAVIGSISFDRDAAICVLDLGCGTGTIAAGISGKFPKSHIVCLDLASNMIDSAKRKLANHKDVEFITGDFSRIGFNGNYDAIVSSLALHHLETDGDKKAFYAKIYGNLRLSGIFFNADVVLASSEYHQEVYMRRWIEYMSKSISKDEIYGKWIPTHNREDRPARLMDQLKWLGEIGFRSIDVIWKYYNFCVYGGVK